MKSKCLLGSSGTLRIVWKAWHRSWKIFLLLRSRRLQSLPICFPSATKHHYDYMWSTLATLPGELNDGCLQPSTMFSEASGKNVKKSMWWTFQILWVTLDNTSGILELFFNEKYHGKNKNKFMKMHIFCLLHCTKFSYLSALSCHSISVSLLIIYRTILWHFPTHYIPLMVIS